MNPTNQSHATGSRGHLIDFAPSKTGSNKTKPSLAPTPSPTDVTEQPTLAPDNSRPTPVTSAQAAINAMYAARAEQPNTTDSGLTARELVNASAAQSSARNHNSASSLHHGSIQKSMESTRTSASALLRVAKGDSNAKTVPSHKGSLDPLAKPRLVPAKPKRARAVNAGEVPVVRTSLKLGAAARPKSAPVILPANSRMANQAYPVGTSGSHPQAKLSRILGRQPANPQPTSRLNLNPRKPRVIAASSSAMTPAQNGSIAVASVSSQGATPPAHATRPHNSPLRDPQMVGGARPHRSKAMQAAKTTRAAEIIDQQMGQPARFRSAPKGFAAKEPAPVPAENAYVMSEPPKINAKKAPRKVNAAKLGVIENYHQSATPKPIGDKAPIGRVSEQKVASDHGGAATNEYNTIKTDNTSNYSFSRKTDANANHYALGGGSPFLKSVNVEKRPLSDSSSRSSSLSAPSTAPAKANSRSSRKNLYPKKNKTERTSPQDLPSRPTVIVPSSHRSKVPLFFLVVITVVLGAAVGAAAYLCFFQ